MARAEAAGTGQPMGAILDRLRAQERDRQEAAAIRAEALQSGVALPDPVPDVGHPNRGQSARPPEGSRDAAAYDDRAAKAQEHYIKSGDPRDLAQLVVKHPEWGRWGAFAWRDPMRAIGKMPPGVRGKLRRCATARGSWGEWGRGLVATAYLIHRLAQKTARSGVQVLAGCSGGMLAGSIPSASGARQTLSANTLLARRHAHAPGVPGTEGRHGGLAGDAMAHQCGYIEALRQIGVLYAFQPRPDVVPRWQLGSRGYACLQFLLPDALWRTPDSGAPPPD